MKALAHLDQVFSDLCQISKHRIKSLDRNLWTDRHRWDLDLHSCKTRLDCRQVRFDVPPHAVDSRQILLDAVLKIRDPEVEIRKHLLEPVKREFLLISFVRHLSLPSYLIPRQKKAKRS